MFLWWKKSSSRWDACTTNTHVTIKTRAVHPCQAAGPARSNRGLLAMKWVIRWPWICMCVIVWPKPVCSSPVNRSMALFEEKIRWRISWNKGTISGDAAHTKTSPLVHKTSWSWSYWQWNVSNYTQVWNCANSFSPCSPKSHRTYIFGQESELT
jgi:hypothetical protein